ncbi:hypothetical protein CYMTET_22576 [Cymbomonas tetramitiformis]|uniref:Reverse transcriptase domain-containing protein n=1 Tax=Cymbomonas tetramitiformis TaxID=36881 RepID=A0AAE0F339_9CHLO|nr:hypothetical protein CYMTET_41920 [Cymbomonas tetramitiformis]KAK3268948.1 hypothetical protein CYMTET_22576 [Cymbomonas tetramitiformis]
MLALCYSRYVCSPQPRFQSQVLREVLWAQYCRFLGLQGREQQRVRRLLRFLTRPFQLLQTQLQKQAEDHAAALAAIQTQMTAQAAAHAAALEAAPARAAVVAVDPAIQLLYEELSKSVLVTEKWSLETLDVLAEVLLVHARRLSVLIVATGSTRFGVDPFETVRPAKMPLLVHFCRELLAEDPDTLVGPRATIELLQARVFLLKKTLVGWQEFVSLVDPSFVTTDFQALGGTRVAASVPERAMPAVGQLTWIPKTPAKAELYRQRESDIEAAMRGDPISEEAAQFSVMLEFYDFLMKLVADNRADMSEHRVNTVWQEFQLLKSREGTDIYTPSSRVSPNPKAPKLPLVEPAPKSAALTKPPKFKGQCCWNFNKVSPPKRSSRDDVQAKVARRASPVKVALPADVAGVMPVPVAPHSFQKDTTTVSLAVAGTSITQWHEFISELREAGASVPNMTTNACRMAAAFKTDPDKVFLVWGAACGIGFPFSSVPEDTFYTVENYVPAEHWEAMDKEIRKERAAGNVVMVKMEWNIKGISAVGVVAKERKGVIKFTPVWDYARPEDVGVNSRIDLEKEKFSSIKDAYALLRPGLWMAKLDLTAAYRSVPVAAMYWIAHVFEWDEQVPRTLMEGLLGLLAFYGQVVYGLSLYTRYANALLAKAKGKYLHLTDKVVQDLKMIVTVTRLYNGRKIRLDRVEIKWEWFSSDASTGKGMGAVLDRRWFAVTWAWLIC